MIGGMRYWMTLLEDMLPRVYRNTSLATLKILAKRSPSQAARFVIVNHELHAADAEAFTHYDLWSPQTGIRGWLYYDGDDRFSYKAVGFFDMLPAYDPTLQRFERAGIRRRLQAN